MDFRRITAYLGLLGPYSIAVSALYLFGYWSQFNINILEYIDVSDVVGLSIYPILYSSFFIALGAVGGHIAIGNDLPPGGGANTRLGRCLRANSRIIGVFIIFSIAVIITIIKEPDRWFYVAMLIAVPADAALQHVRLVQEILPDPRLRSSILFCLLIMPGLSFAIGNREAYERIEGSGNKFIEIIKPTDLKDCFPKEKQIYLGLAGKRLFTLSQETKKVTVLQEGELKAWRFYDSSEDTKPIKVPKSESKTETSFLIRFNHNETVLPFSGEATISDILQKFPNISDLRVEISGHTDSTGESIENDRISIERAKEVRRRLIELGIRPSQISITAYGENSLPVETPDGIKEPDNRCTKLKIFKVQNLTKG